MQAYGIDDKINLIKSEYQPLKFLGNGSFGSVYKVKHLVTGKIHAMKIIPDVYSSTYNFKKIIREIQILNQLSLMKGNIFTS